MNNIDFSNLPHNGNINKELLSKKYKDREKVLNFLESCWQDSNNVL